MHALALLILSVVPAPWSDDVPPVAYAAKAECTCTGSAGCFCDAFDGCGCGRNPAAKYSSHPDVLDQWLAAAKQQRGAANHIPDAGKMVSQPGRYVTQCEGGVCRRVWVPGSPQKSAQVSTTPQFSARACQSCQPAKQPARRGLFGRRG